MNVLPNNVIELKVTDARGLSNMIVPLTSILHVIKDTTFIQNSTTTRYIIAISTPTGSLCYFISQEDANILFPIVVNNRPKTFALSNTSIDIKHLSKHEQDELNKITP